MSGISKTDKKEIIIKKQKDGLTVLDVLKIIITEKPLTQFKIKYVDKTFLVPVPEDFKYANPVPYKFEYPENVPVKTPVPVPEINPDELKEKVNDGLDEVFSQVNAVQILQGLFNATEARKVTLIEEKIKIPQLDMGDLKDKIEDLITVALSKIDLKALLHEALKKVTVTLYDLNHKEVTVPEIKKGRTVIEHTIIPRKTIVPLQGFRLIDEKGETIAEIEPPEIEG